MSAEQAIETANTLRERIETVRNAAGAEPRLVHYSVAGMQRMIFDTTRQAGIRASSRELAAFDAKVQEKFPKHVVFARGGHGLLLVPARQCGAIQSEIPTLRSVALADTIIGTVDIAFDGTTPERERASLQWLWHVAEARRDETKRPEFIPPNSSGRDLCFSCNKRDPDRSIDPDKYVPDPPEGRYLCCRCRDLFVADRSRRVAPNKDLTKLSPDFIACLSADGNNVGRLFTTLGKLESLAAASASVGELFAKAVEEIRSTIGDNDIVAPITGGDDIRMFFRPGRLEDGRIGLDLVVSSLVDAVRTGRDRAAGRFDSIEPGLGDGLRSIGVGIGVVIAPVRHPALRLLGRAHEAEKSAKTFCHDRSGQHRSAAHVMVQISGDESLEGMQGTKPHDLEKADDPQGWRPFISAIEALTLVPRGQRAMIRAAIGTLLPHNERELLNLFRYQVARHRQWQKYLEACGVDWTARSSVEVPSEQMFLLADLFGRERSDGDARHANDIAAATEMDQ